MTNLGDRLHSLVRAGIEQGVFPGAAVSVRKKGQLVLNDTFGHAEIVPKVRAMRAGMTFDIASLTKVMATLPAVLRTVRAGKVSLDRPIADYLPEWGAEGSRRAVTLTHLLTHTSGLPAWRPYYVRLHTAEEYCRQICREPLEYEPCTRVVYSDLGMQLAGFLLERIWQKSLVEICSQLVFEPLELSATGFYAQHDVPVPSTSKESQIGPIFVATEVGNVLEHGMCMEYAEKCRTGMLPEGAFFITEQDIAALAWRTATSYGTVNDGNCYYGLHGISGHAGLFSTVEDVARYLAMWREGGQVGGQTYLDRDLVSLVVSNRTKGLNLARGLGFEIAYKSNAFGHTGFTGTSLWYDPESDTEAVVLTNRVHPQVKAGIVDWRRTFHSVAFE
ncbi:hypothetical protein CIG75_10235 [Tumebacillus algifaecis]|uniref:Beta-lactamase-related domain-containing protein n=1 Tax=Tumebacillus algifaecis TaxID=1214604 RepID=A0A223D140_9BACL|nr:serine hydrolase domain-containing protein [Tumebacillus algifaecis]ASS75330.1 hypothetical protein CIG75_10235 [Tumebacillus algifaecis]